MISHGLRLWERKLLNKIFKFNGRNRRRFKKKKSKMRSYIICTHRMVLFGHKMNEN